MPNFSFLRDVIILAAMLMIAWTGSAHAYIDPGSGGVLITAILGFFAAIGYTFRKWFYGLKSKLGLSSPENDDDDDI